MQGLREQGKQRRRDEILLAARSLIIEGGAEALTMRALAQRSGVSVPTIYGLIGGRDAVIAAMMERGGDQLDAALADASAEPAARLLDAVELFAASLVTNESVARELFGAGTQWNAPGAMRHRLGAVFAEGVAELQRTRVLETWCTADALAAQLDATVLGVVGQWVAGEIDGTALALRLRHGVATFLTAHARPAHRDGFLRECRRAARALPAVERQVPTAPSTVRRPA